MISAYKNDSLLFIYTLICIFLLSTLLVSVNIILNKLIKRKNSLDKKKYAKRKETYEFGVNSLNTVNTVNTSQPLILALLFLLFDIEVTLLVPIISSLQNITPAKQGIAFIYILFIMISVYIEIAGNVISFYKSKKTKYVI